MGPKKFFSELKRRNVYKIAISYGITGWLLAQVAGLVTNAFEAPLWVIKMIIITLIIGFPIALILAWVYEMSPKGLIKTKPKDRRLAAIMFTRIIGYTDLMASDEDRAFEILQKNREIHTQLIEKYNGKIIREMGGGLLISFKLATDAVHCAINIQSECKKQDIPLKIGIHEGEMVFEGMDVLGDGVNIASCLQESAEEGSIFISGSVYRDVKNKKHIKTQFIEERSFKNVDDPMKVYLVSSEDTQFNKIPSIKLDPGQNGRKPIISFPYVKIGSVILLLTVLVIFYIFFSGKSIPFEERDWIVITDFENLTEESIFDNSLNTAFTLNIDQSRYLNVITRQRMLEALKRMKKGDIKYINEEIGREIAIREGVQIYLVPGISRVGTQYILTVKIQDVKTADTLRSEVLYAKNQDEIIGKLDELTKKTRRILGESRYKISEQSKPLSNATTSSLEALKQYSLGIQNHKNLNFEKAKVHYENAIRIDTSFTSAKASLGNLLFERFDREKGREWLDQAILSIDNLTDKEKYSVLAFYAVNIEKDFDKGIEYIKSLIELYPDDPVPHNNLGWYFQKQKLYESAVNEYRAALQIDPYMMLTYGGINWVFMDFLGEIDSVRTWSNRMIKYGPENEWGYFYQGSAYVGLDSLEKAEISYSKARSLNRNFLMNQWRLAHVYRLLGKHDKAIEVLEEILSIDPEEKFANYDIGINYTLMGEHEKARSKFLQLKKMCEQWMKEDPKNVSTHISFGLVLSRLEQKEAAWKIGKRAIELDSTIHIRFAELLAVQDKKSEALDHLEKALDNGYRDLVWLKLNPNLQILHNDPRFQDLLDQFF